MCIGVCLQVCLYEGIRSPGTGETDSCELPCRFWELSPGPLEEQPVLLNHVSSPKCHFVNTLTYLFMLGELLAGVDRKCDKKNGCY